MYCQLKPINIPVAITTCMYCDSHLITQHFSLWLSKYVITNKNKLCLVKKFNSLSTYLAITQHTLDLDNMYMSIIIYTDNNKYILYFNNYVELVINMVIPKLRIFLLLIWDKCILAVNIVSISHTPNISGVHLNRVVHWVSCNSLATLLVRVLPQRSVKLLWI